MIESLFSVSLFTLAACSIASVLSGIAWMRYEQEREQLDARWPTDGITKEPKLNR